MDREQAKELLPAIQHCIYCEEDKSVSYFSKDKNRSTGYSNVCKVCNKVRMKSYRQSKKGLVSTIYGNQKNHSKVRGHNKPTYSKTELTEWLFAQERFHELYNEWKASGYARDKSPSVDRLDDSKSYLFSNIQLITWQDNLEKQARQRQAGEANKGGVEHTPVASFDKNGENVKEYISQQEASRQTGVWQANINKVLKGEYKTTGDLYWVYLDKHFEARKAYALGEKIEVYNYDTCEWEDVLKPSFGGIKYRPKPKEIYEWEYIHLSTSNKWEFMGYYTDKEETFNWIKFEPSKRLRST